MGKYSDLIAESQQDIERQRARNAGLIAPDVSPDDMGRAFAKADRLGQPAGVVAQNLSQYDEQDHLDRLSGAAEDNPVLARWLGDPNHSALAKDDVGTLGGIGRFLQFGLLSGAPVLPALALPRNLFQDRPAAQGPTMQAEQPSWFSEFVGDLQSGWYSGKQGVATVGLPDLASPRTRNVEEQVARGLGFEDLTGAEAARTGVQVAQFGRQSEGASRRTRAAEEGLAEITAAGERGWAPLAGAILRNPRAVMAVTAQSLGATAPNLALSAIPASRLMSAATVGAGSGLAEQGFTVLDVMSEAGVDTSDAAQVTGFLRNKEALAAAKSKAVSRGVAVGAFDALTAGFAGQLLRNARRSAFSIVPRVAGEAAVQAGGGAAGEAAAQLASEGQVSSRADIALEAAAEVPTFLAEGRGRFAEARRMAEANADRFDAQAEQKSLTRLVTLASESKTRTRSANRFESLIRDMAAEGEDTVYIPAEAARTLFQSGNEEGARGPLEGLVSPSEFAEAVATGGELAIPLGQYVTFLSPEQHAAIADQVRLQPGMRHDMAAVTDEDITEAIRDGLAEAEGVEQRDTGPAGQVFDEIYGQLLGKQGEKLARQNAAVVQSVYRNLAERSGTDAWALFQQFRINIPGVRRDARGAPRGVDIDVDPLLDALRDGKLPTDAEVYGEGLASALVRAGGLQSDAGGELANLEANRRPGLVTLTGMTLDDALVWAHQEGFISESPTQFRDQFEGDAPDINTLLDLLGRDLSGTRVTRPVTFNPARARFREDAQALQAELDQRGVDLAQVDNQRAREALGLTAQTGATTAENDIREGEGLPRLYQSAVPEATELETLRARVAELERELRTDRLTGLRNQRAFDEDASLGWPVVSAADMDGLKRLNDSVGHEAADEVLRVLGGIMLAEEGASARFYRRSGDEFSARFQDQETADRVMADLQARLEEVAIDFDVTDADGNIQPLTYEGIGISYGNGPDYAAADAAANRNKADRLAAGVREEARADGQPRRLRPRRDSRWGEGRRAGEGPARSADVGEGSTLNQSAVTDTPEFRAWFGDSKVVDENGQPLVVYHGSPTRGIEAFDIGRAGGRTDFGNVGIGVYTTPKKYIANAYAKDPNSRTASDDLEGEVLPLYLSIKNPLRVIYDERYQSRIEAIARDMGVTVDPKWRGGGPSNRDFAEQFTAAAKAAGYDGAFTTGSDGELIEAVAYSPNQIKSATANRGTFDPDDPSILNQSERGSVTFRRGKDGGRQFDVQLLAGMDASTFLHEMGHVYLEVINDLSARDGAPQQIKDDVATIDAWVKREADQPYTVDQHEQFARGFEAWLREGNAPTSALRRAFAAFKVWLTAIYRSAAALNVELTPEVREVFDRIVASDAEIAEARGEQYLEPLIGDALAVGMSPEDFDAYNRAVLEARADAEAVVAAELLRAMQIEQRAWYREERRNVQAEVTQQIRESPVYRAQRLLRTGRLPDGTEAPDALQVKLDKNDLLDRYGQSFLRNLRGTYALEGGATSDEVAAVLGFRSGDELVTGLVNAPPISEAIRAETDARMAERHPDPMVDGTLPDRAMVAAHREKQAEVMVREIRALEGRSGGRPSTQAAVVKGIAQALIARKKLRQLQPATYRSAEAKAGREAFEAARTGDWDAALAARRRQLLNFELFREAVRARNEALAIAKRMGKFGETRTRQRLGKAGGEYLAQIDALLDRFDFRKITDKAADRRASLAAWIQLQAERGQELQLPDRVMDEAFRLPYRELTMEQLREVNEAVVAIDHLARLKGKLLLGKETRDAATIDAEMAASVRLATPERLRGTGDEPNRRKILRAFQQGRVLQATATDLARELDGFRPGAAVWRNTVGVIRDAVNNEVNPRLQQMGEAVATLYREHYTVDEIRRFGDLAPMPEVNGDLWSKRRLLALALNWGNDGNRAAILEQRDGRLTQDQVDQLLGRLDARDWAFVQGVWGLVDGYWPDIAEAQRRRIGLAPEKVVPTPFTVRTSDGRTLTIKGGYYPLKYESDTVKTMKDEADEFYKAVQTGRAGKAATRRGHTIERVGSGGRTVKLDTGVIQQHLRDVIRDLYLGDAVNYVHNVLQGPQFQQAINDTAQQEYARALEVWLRDVAAGEIGPRVWHERAFRAARTNFTASVLGFKPVSAMLQVTGLVQSSVVLGQADVWQATGQYLTKPIAMTRYVQEASPYMRSRMQTHVEAVQQVMDAEAGRYAAGKSAMIRWAYWMMGRVQQMVDTATWMAAESQGMRLFENDVARARQYADDAVSRAQSSGEFIDKNPLQRGTLSDSTRQTEWVKAATVLQSYMWAKGNAAYEVTRKTNFKSPIQVIRWMSNMAMLFAVEALIVAAIRGKLPDDDDDDGITDELVAFTAKETLAGAIGSVPGASGLVTEFRGYDAKGVLATAWGAYADTYEQAMQGEWDRAAQRAAVTSVGITFGLPTSQINNTINAVTASANGEDVSPYEYLTGPKAEGK